MIFRGARWVLDRGEAAVIRAGGLIRGVNAIRAGLLLREIEDGELLLPTESLELGRQLMRNEA